MREAIKLGRQTERVGIYPTLSAVFAEKGIALPEVCNQYPCNVGKEYTDYKCDALFNFLFYHFIIHLTFRPPDWGRFTQHNYIISRME
jgi:hypothetical protein